VLVCLLLQAAAVYVPLLQRVLNTVPLGTADWALIAACSLAPVAIVELVKVVQRQIRMVTAARQPSITFNTNP
jgi:Ca2+-transporting ATPase